MFKYSSHILLRPLQVAGISSVRYQSATNGLDGEKQPTAFEKRLDDSKKGLQWRLTTDDNPREWYSNFKLWVPEDKQTTDIIRFLQTPINLSLSARKESKEKKRIKLEKFMQQFIPERHDILGNDLAAAHFIVYRGGAVRFSHDQNWVKKDEMGNYALPSKFNPSYTVEAIRCDDMELFYEGLENIRRLKHMKFISFRNVKNFDDWCLDRVSGSQFESLEILDISATKVTERGLQCLYRIPSLKMLIIDDPKKSIDYEFTCVQLQDIIPKLKITPATAIHGDLN